MALIVVGAVLGGLFALLAFAGNPVFFAMGMVPSLLAFALGIWGCLWLDRWEPEPIRLILLALTWGGGLAIVASLILEIAVMGGSDFIDSAVVAPVVEEAMKGSFVLFMLTGRRLREMNSITDYITYAAMVGFGFAFIENLVYFSSAETAAQVAIMAIVRTGFDIFGHPLATVAFGIGLFYARQRRNWWLGILGFVVAVFLHGAWNGAAVVSGFVGLIVVYVVIMLPALVVVIRLATAGRKREGALLARYLPEMVNNGLISWQEASWIGNLKARGHVRQAASSSAESKAHVAYLLDAVVDLAHVREQFDIGRGSAALMAQQVELVNGIHLERAAAYGVPLPRPGGLGWQPSPMPAARPVPSAPVYAAPPPGYAPQPMGQPPRPMPGPPQSVGQQAPLPPVQQPTVQQPPAHQAPPQPVAQHAQQPVAQHAPQPSAHPHVTQQPLAPQATSPWPAPTVAPYFAAPTSPDAPVDWRRG